jgi:hypothetical protein
LNTGWEGWTNLGRVEDLDDLRPLGPRNANVRPSVHRPRYADRCDARASSGSLDASGRLLPVEVVNGLGCVTGGGEDGAFVGF